MKRLVCCGCGLGEDLDAPTGDIHTVQIVDLHPQYDLKGSPDKTIQEDLCRTCRERLRRDFFGEVDEDLLDMPVMSGS